MTDYATTCSRCEVAKNNINTCPAIRPYLSKTCHTLPVAYLLLLHWGATCMNSPTGHANLHNVRAHNSKHVSVTV